MSNNTALDRIEAALRIAIKYLREVHNCILPEHEEALADLALIRQEMANKDAQAVSWYQDLQQALKQIEALRQDAERLRARVAACAGTKWEDLPAMQRKGLEPHAAYALGHSIGVLNAIQAIDAARAKETPQFLSPDGPMKTPPYDPARAKEKP